MDIEFLKSLPISERELLIRKELGPEKCKFLDKYDLKLNDRFYFERIQEKYPDQEYFSYKLATKSSLIGMIFHINRLCFAKTKYFEKNINNYVPCIHSCRNGFVETDMWNMEFLKQKGTNIIIDLRDLSKIHWVADFHDLCNYLELELDKFNAKIRSNASDLNIRA